MNEVQVHNIDSVVRERAVYVHDRVDLWRSFAKELLADPRYQMQGDCDDWAQTALHLAYLTGGVSKKDLIRAVVISNGSATPDHMIGIVRLDDGNYMTIGDTFGPSEKFSATNLVGARVSGHTIVAVSSFADKLLWRGRLRRKANTANRGMKLSALGMAVLKGHERCVLGTYDDKQPKKALQPGDKILGKLTNGWGHTGPDVKIGQKLTQAEADANLVKDLAWAEAAVIKYVNVPITQGQFDGLTLFTFNAGEKAFKESTLLKLVNKKASDEQIGVQFRRWINSGGQVMGGLVTRREDEFKLYKGGEKPVAHLSTAVSPAPVVEEHTKLIKSKAIWGNIVQFALGLMMSAPEMLAPAQQLQDQVQGENLKAIVGVGISVIAFLMFARRFYEIKVAAAK